MNAGHHNERDCTARVGESGSIIMMRNGDDIKRIGAMGGKAGIVARHHFLEFHLLQ
jgi:hypothetical protein